SNSNSPQVLSAKKLPKYNKKPTFRSQKLENVSVALKFLQRDENIKLVNIGDDCAAAWLRKMMATLMKHGRNHLITGFAE
ncbi:unnamed protein product, partial [Cyprideis torosa]